MTELRKCSRCRSEIELKYFSINRKGEHHKTCETCLSKNRNHVKKKKEEDRVIPNEIMKTSGEHMLHTMLDDSSDDGDVWGGKKD